MCRMRKSLRDFGTQQAAMMNELSQQMQEDARVMSEMSLRVQSGNGKTFGEAGKQMPEPGQLRREAWNSPPRRAASRRAKS